MEQIFEAGTLLIYSVRNSYYFIIYAAEVKLSFVRQGLATS